jgi:uncharacterized protein (DUF885 family)
MTTKWKLSVLAVIPLLFVSPGAASEKPASPSAVLQKAADDYWSFLETESLAIRVREGLPVDRMPDISFEHSKSNAAFGKSLVSRLAPLAASGLSHEEALTLAILRKEAQQLVEAPRYYWLTFPVTPYGFRGLGVHQAFASHLFKSRADGSRYLALLESYADFIRALTARLQEQARRGIVLAREEIPLAADAFAAATNEGEENLLYVKASRLSNLTDVELEHFRRHLGQTIAWKVVPAVKELVAYLTGDYAAKAPAAVGLAQYPGGKDYYRALVRRSTTLNVSPETIHQTGLAGIARLNAELDAVRRKVAFAGTLAEFRQFLKTDARFFAKTPEEVGERLMAAQNRILAAVPNFFGTTPKAPFGVQRLEAPLEGAVTFGYYQQPTAQDPKGYYKYNGSKLDERSLLFAGALISHELVPGHHFQINLQRENEGLPKFRRESFYTAFGEGWGEYASDLAGQMGMYEDPYDRAGRIAMDLFLTSRLVVDTGMNYFGWPRAKAIAYMKENTLQSDAEIDTETLRYCCDMPSQALAYKMGMRRLVQLREKAKKSLGPAFDIRKYHDAVLGSGSLPMDILERHVNWFIAREGGKPSPSPGGGGRSDS